MTPVVGRKGPVRYRYYASHATTQGRHSDAGSVPRVPAHDIETQVVAELRRALGDGYESANERELIDRSIDRVILSTAGIELHVRRTEGEVEPISILWNAPRHRQRRAIADPHEGAGAQYIRSTERARLLSGIVKARGWVRRLVSGEATAVIDIAEGEGISERSARMTLALAFIPPVIIRAAIAGTLPRRQAVARLAASVLDWRQEAHELHNT
jgi:hypothetical protein